MTEKEYFDVTDVQLLRSINYTLRLINANDDPNKIRLNSISANINLMIKDLETNVESYVDD